MIQLNNIELLRGPKQLLVGASLQINPREKVGLVGLNGCGKSSLFQLFLGQLQCDAGVCQWPKAWRISHMLQEIVDYNSSAIDFVIDGDQELRAVEQAIAEHEGDETALAQLYTRLEELDGYTAQARAAQLLNGLGFQPEDINKPVADFSGGWRVRLALAQALMKPSDLLLLDEPTNHLDLSAALWLERWLKHYTGTLIIVSHDRDFLDQVVDIIVHIEHQQLQRYSGNYSQFETQRAERLALQQAQYNKQQQRIAEIDSFVRRFRYKASKAKQAQSRLKELERMEKIAPAHVDSPFHFRIPCADKIPSSLISLNQVDIGYGTTTVVGKIDISLLAASRVGLLGLNGAGKSTLLKSLAGELPILAGQRHTGDGLKVGYFAQHQLQSLDLNASPAVHIQRANEDLNQPHVREQDIRQFLGGFDFQGDRVFEPVGQFSGGEKARLTLALIAWSHPNVLILDEPTNHLDLEMRHALTVALQDYVGAVIVVSHDRHLLRNTVDELWLIHEGHLHHYQGNLDDYQTWLSELSSSGQGAAPIQNGQSKKQQRQQAAQQRAALKPLNDKVKKLEKQLENLQQQRENLAQRLTDNQLYTDDNKDRLQDLLQQQAELTRAVNQCEEDWIQAQLALEQAQQ